MGAAPKWFAATVLLPEHADHEELAADIFDQITGACDALGAALCGGHTEITRGLDRAIVVGFMLGELPKDRVIRGDTDLIKRNRRSTKSQPNHWLHDQPALYEPGPYCPYCQNSYRNSPGKGEQDGDNKTR